MNVGPTLIPDESSSIGKEVNRLWKLINSVNDEILTYGILIFHDLSTSSMHPMAHRMAKEIGIYVFNSIQKSNN